MKASITLIGGLLLCSCIEPSHFDPKPTYSKNVPISQNWNERLIRNSLQKAMDYGFVNEQELLLMGSLIYINAIYPSHHGLQIGEMLAPRGEDSPNDPKKLILEEVLTGISTNFSTQELRLLKGFLEELMGAADLKAATVVIKDFQRMLHSLSLTNEEADKLLSIHLHIWSMVEMMQVEPGLKPPLSFEKPQHSQYSESHHS
jgi:hypothetical protein